MSGAEKTEYIEVIGAREHNLKGVDVSIPIGRLTCVTGPSGCGKSSLVYDTVYAESQRLFLESMSGSMFGQRLMQAPRVTAIRNLRPALDVSQNYYNFNPRSTVGTLTDTSAFLRTLFALTASHERGTRFEENAFSSNNPTSWCPKCHGTGREYVISYDAVVPDKDKRIADGAIAYYKGGKSTVEHKTLVALCEHYGIDMKKRFSELSSDEISELLYAEVPVELSVRYKSARGSYRQKKIRAKGAITELKDKLLDVDTPSTYASIQRFLDTSICSVCHGSKLRSEIASVSVCGMGISDVESCCLDDALAWVDAVVSSYAETAIAEPVGQLCSQISKRLEALISLKVGYLSIARTVPSLSGGETQRVRLANQLCCSLNGLMYVLDEPSKGLHPRDLPSVEAATRGLVDRGNTVVAIEHNGRFVAASDEEIRMGPSGGPSGGYVLYVGPPSAEPNSPLEFKRPIESSKLLVLRGITYNNLVGQDVSIPIGSVTAISGVSGSGKSSLLESIELCLRERGESPCDYVNGAEHFRGVRIVDQRPIGKTPRSTVVSYLGVYDELRDVFSASADAKARGLEASAFSMNVEGGRCESCKGTGVIKISYQHLPDTYVECSTCHGGRFREDVLAVRYGGLNIRDVLENPVEAIIEVFSDNAKIAESLRCLVDVGLGYLRLGQPSMSLSGGEAQRIKLAKALGRKTSGCSLYLLDEPTTGLDASDANRISRILIEMANRGDTVVVVEHDPSFIALTADYLIDFGEGAGASGGRVVSRGTPRDVFNDPKSSWCGLL